MDWIQIPVDAILYSEFTKTETFTLIRYHALYAQLEKEPSLQQKKRLFSNKEISFLDQNAYVLNQNVIKSIQMVEKKRNANKIFYEQKQSVSENSASLKSAGKRSRLDKTRLDNKKENIKRKKTYPENLNIEKWEEWIKDRKERNLKPYKKNSAMNALAKFSKDVQAKTIDSSIANEYQGLFPEKFDKIGVKNATRSKYETNAERLARNFEQAISNEDINEN